MINHILLLVISFGSILSCTTTSQELNNDTAPRAKTVAQVIPAVQDSVPTKTKKRSYIIDTARPKTEIEQKFPYDIDLKGIDGQIVNSSEALKANGKPTILLFWLTTCYPCRVEMKAIKELYASWQTEADFNLVAISTDFPKNYDNFVKLVQKNNWAWQSYNDVNREFRYVLPGGLNGLPQSFILDADGNIVYHKRKYSSGDEKRLFERVKALSK